MGLGAIRGQAWLSRLEGALDRDGAASDTEILGSRGTSLIHKVDVLTKIVITAKGVVTLGLDLELGFGRAAELERLVKGPLARTRLEVLGLANEFLLWRDLSDHDIQIRRRWEARCSNDGELSSAT